MKHKKNVNARKTLFFIVQERQKNVKLVSEKQKL